MEFLCISMVFLILLYIALIAMRLLFVALGKRRMAFHCQVLSTDIIKMPFKGKKGSPGYWSQGGISLPTQ